MTISILVNGAFGRMGQMATKAIAAKPHFKLVGETGREYNLQRSIKDSGAQVVVDFTRADVVFENANLIIESGARPIIGTTGLTAEQIKILQKKCAGLGLGGIIAPNFSLGAILMLKHAKEIAKYMPNVEIIEMHHSDKADSPSGTSIRSAEVLTTVIDKINPSAKVSKEIVPGARGANYKDVPIHSVRLPGLLAHQQIIFGNTGETLTLRHDSIDRQCFMPGVCFACEKVMSLDHLVYGLEELV